MFYNSVILNCIFTIMKKAYETYLNSYIARFFSALSSLARRLISGSKIFSFIGREDCYTRFWKNSAVFKVVDGFFGVITRCMLNVYRKYEDYFTQSVAFKLLNKIIQRFEICIGVFIIIVVTIPHSYWNNMYTTGLVALLIALYFVKAVINSKDDGFSIKALDFALVLFMICVVFAEVMSIDPGLSLRYFIFYVTCFLLVLVIVSSVKTVKSLTLLIELMLIGVTISALYGAYQFMMGIPADPSLSDPNLNVNAPGRVFSSMGNPNNYAEVLLLTLPFYSSIIMNSKSLKKKIIYGILALPSFVAILLTQARSSWIAFAIMVMVFLFFKNRKLIPVIILAGLLFIPFMPQFLYRRIMTIFNTNDTSNQYRLQIYSLSFPMLKDYWLTGIGLDPDLFQVMIERYGKLISKADLYVYEFSNNLSEIEMLYTNGKVPVHTHNLWLQIWMETGIMGIVTFLWFIARIIKKCIINIINKVDESINNILLAGMCSVIGVGIMGLAEYAWFYSRVMVMFWTIIGIVLAGLGILMSRREVFAKDNKQ